MTRRPTAALLGTVALTLGAALAAPTATSAAETPSLIAADPNPCGIEGWYQNPDEGDRAPERTYDGFVFEATDLIHHAAPADLTTDELSSGDFNASPAPDQPSFFSVEVNGTDGGYATLRYNRLTHLWDMVTGGILYSNADPDKLVDMPPVKRSHKVVSFGVGYTKNPPGVVKTTVTSIAFQGKVYTFKCLKPTLTSSPTATPSTSTSPTQSASPSTTVTPSKSSTASPTASATRPSATATATNPVPVPADNGSDGELPTTGASLGGLILVGLGAMLVGGVAIFWFRKRKRRGLNAPY